MAGNVWEWVADPYAEYPEGTARDRWVLATSGRRVLRGGSFVDSADDARSALRDRVPSRGRVGLIGFRLVRPAVPALED